MTEDECPLGRALALHSTAWTDNDDAGSPVNDGKAELEKLGSSY